MATNNLLTQAAPDYRKFVDNQVLTDDQLNAGLDHLDYQDQLSRVLLSGVGIVCGLNISKVQDKSGKPAVHLSKGAAVTTAGNLIKCDARYFKGFKRFEDREVQYSHFTGMLPLWELETNLDPSDVHSLDQFETTTETALDEAVGLLYLENYLHDQEECSPIDCDTQGREAIHKLRLLLVSLENVKAIAQRDTIFAGLLQNGEEPTVQKIKRIYAPRVVLKPANTAMYDEFKQAYKMNFTELANRINKLGSITLFKETFEQEGLNLASELKNHSTSFRNIQYLYDFYKDLVTAYNEVQYLLKKNYAICCPDPEAFPKHVLLGQLFNEESKWRHGFYPSPTHNQQNSIAIMLAAFKRILLMIEHFNPAPKNGIKITPSRGDDAQLGKRAVPFYYDLEDAQKPDTFLDNWESERGRMIPNYYGHGYPTFDNPDKPDFDPLDVCLQNHDFYRIEGHVGEDVGDVHDKIQDIKKKKGLAFDVKRIAIGENADAGTIDYDKHRVYFEDLQVVLQAWDEEQKCMIEEATKFLSGFSTKVEGKHTAYTPETDIKQFNDVYTVLPGYAAQVSEIAEAISVAPRLNTVRESFAQTENTTGQVMGNLVQAVDDRYAIQVNVINSLNNLMLDWDQDLKTAAVDIPARLIGYLKETEDYKLIDIEDFTKENLQKYIKALEGLCEQSRQAKKQFQQLIPRLKNKDNEYVKPWIKQYEYILNRIVSSCCIIKKIKVLYKKIMERREKLLGRLVLDKFMKDHPGAEHKAGVERGGTFVLIYYSNKSKMMQPIDRVYVEEVLPRYDFSDISYAQLQMMSIDPGIAKTAQHGRKERIDLSKSNVKKEIQRRAKKTRRTLGRSLSVHKPELEISGRAGRAKKKIPHGTVIGDLCLPYICCSDAPPTQFVFPEQLAELRLPTDHICMDEKDGADSIPLNVKPAEGDIKAFIQKRELSGAISVNQTGSYFVPNKVSDNDYGKAIRFEVNGQPVDPELTLYRKPTAKFSVKNIEYFKNNTVAGVTFKNTSTPFNELSFEWDFGGKVEHNKGVKEFSREFQIKPNQHNEFEVRLTASNGPCRATHLDTVNINLEEPEEDCEATYLQKITDSRDLIEKELDEHPKVLKGLKSRYYASGDDKLVKYVLDKIINSSDATFKGKFDEGLYSFIIEQQGHLLKDLYGDYSEIELEFILMLYFELMLLYIYIQVCRDQALKWNDSIMDDRGWLAVTSQIISKYPNVMKQLLEKDKVYAKLSEIQEKIAKLAENEMTKLIKKILKLLKDFVEKK